MDTKKFIFYGINLGKVKQASDLINQEMISKNANIAFIQEPYVWKKKDGKVWIGGQGIGVKAIAKGGSEKIISALL